MSRVVLQACLPWLAVLMVLALLAYGLVRAGRARPSLGRLRLLHRDQVGGVQSLSFVLTLPIFVMVMLMIVQVSQLMIGIIVVHYAAYAAARSAAVWIPAGLPSPEGPNCISSYAPDPNAADQVVPILNPESAAYGPAAGGMTYLVQPGSAKYDKIAAAAVLACMPISPSRDLGFTVPSGTAAPDILKATYAAMDPSSASNGAVPKRLDHKLAYAWNNTVVELRFFHKNQEPPLVTYLLPDDPGEFYFNEVGWQDPLTVTVKHNLALLPGPGRLLARYVAGPGGAPDQVSQSITNRGTFYTYPLTASITMGNEGEKPVIPYVYQSN
jgi:hypothetical protein